MENYTIDKEIGKALYGKILLCTENTTKEHVVIKRIQLDAAKKQKSLIGFVKVAEDAEMEKRVYKALRDAGGHRNVLQMLKDFTTSGYDNYVLEYCSRGELFHELETMPGNRLDGKRSNECFDQITQGVVFMHQHGYAHGDLSLENVFVDKHGICKIGDLGLSTETKSLKRNIAGKYFYMAPEMYMGMEYDPCKSDVWALGIILFTMLTGTPLFNKATPSDAGFRFVKSKGLRAICKDWEVDQFIPSDAMHLLENMLQIQPSERYTLAQVRDHAYIQNTMDTSLSGVPLTSLLQRVSISQAAKGA